MAFDPIPESVRKVWDTWNVRGLIILSLSLQTILVLLAPFRKRTSSTFVYFVVWLAYLLAEWAPSFALGVISTSQGDNSGHAHSGDLLALWTPFFLVHSGGPDTITAFALEDNELWVRHMIEIIVQVVVATYIILLTLPGNKLVTPTVIMLLAAILKSTERTRALYHASKEGFKESIVTTSSQGYKYVKIRNELKGSKLKAGDLGIQIDMNVEPKEEPAKTTAFGDEEGILSEDSAVKYAYQFFEIFKGLIVDLIFSFRQQDESRLFFQKRTAEDAYEVILIELNFMYDALYTKVFLLHSPLGFLLRFIAFGLILAALVSFTQLTKGGFHRFDVIITYTLLVSAIVLDSVSMFMVFFSDLTVANIKSLAKRYSLVGGFLERSLTPVLTRKVRKSSEIKLGDDTVYYVLDTPVPCRRWAETISALNLIGYCINEQPRKLRKPMGCFGFMVHIIGSFLCFPFLIIVGFLRYLKKCYRTLGQQCCGRLFGFMGHLIDKLTWVFRVIFNYLGISRIVESYKLQKHVFRNSFPEKLWCFIYQELKRRSYYNDNAVVARMIYEAKGDMALRDFWSGIDYNQVSLMRYAVDMEYDRILLLWHIATDLCYYTQDKGSSSKGNQYREFSKVLSDYMMYLLVRQAKMTSPVAGIWQIRFSDTCAEAKEFFHMRGLNLKPGEGLEQDCQMILEDDKRLDPFSLEGDRNKSVLLDARNLAKELKKLAEQGKDKWEVMCRVWIELLAYAGSHCRAYAHAQALNNGGELITLVWLLTAHFGIGKQFQSDGATLGRNGSG